MQSSEVSRYEPPTGPLSPRRQWQSHRNHNHGQRPKKSRGDPNHGQRPKSSRGRNQRFCFFVLSCRKLYGRVCCWRGASCSTAAAETVPRQSCNASHAVATSFSSTAVVTSVVHVRRHVSDETEAAANASKTGVATMLPAISCKNDSEKSLMTSSMRSSSTGNP